MTAEHHTSPTASDTVDAVVVGAGFGGLYALYQLTQRGLRVRAFEAGKDVGGTWYWNRYPGARCDVESLDYSYSFSEALQQEWVWTERFAAQPEILSYVRHVADRFDLRRHVAFETRVTRAAYDATTNLWTVTTDKGETVKARFCIMATGNLSLPKRPEFDGLDDFKGRWFQTGAWPHKPVNFEGRRVGVIGTGSSGIQAIPVIAQSAQHLTVFQRTPHFTIPARNRPLSDAEQAEGKATYPERRRAARRTPGAVTLPRAGKSAIALPPEDLRNIYEAQWREGGQGFTSLFSDLLVDARSNATCADFARDAIRAVVHDPKTAEALTPRDYPIGAKRICLDTQYYETFNRPNVTLVDVRDDPIERLETQGVRTRSGLHALDDIVFATGFDAITGALLNIEIVGRDGLTLAEKWSSGPATYLGLMTHGFPNLLLLTGPGSPAVFTNVVASIEHHVEWVAALLDHMKASGLTRVEATAEAEADWVGLVNSIAESTLLVRANSWYLGANVPGKPRVFMPYAGGFNRYAKQCEDVAAAGYSGFALA